MLLTHSTPESATDCTAPASGINAAAVPKPPLLEKSLGEVPPACRELYRSGRAALQAGDRAGAIRIFNTALEQEPGFLACREALHAARLQGYETVQGVMERSAESVCAAPWLAEAELYQHSHPKRALTAAEQALNHCPGSLLAHKILAKAALKAGLPRTALLSLEFILQHAPEDTRIALELATALAESGDTARAIATCGRLLKEHPGHRGAQRLMKRLVAFSHSSPAAVPPQTREGYSEPAQPPVAAAEPTSPHNKEVNAATRPEQISRLEALLKHAPKNHLVLKRLGALYAENSDYDRALEFYWRALQVAHGHDPESEQAIQEIGDWIKREKGQTQ